MATTNVLLREDVENLGARGEIVKVKAGLCAQLFAAAQGGRAGDRRQRQAD